MADNSTDTRRGKLTEVLAIRGGSVAPEAVMMIEHREALIYMLCQAAELEHAIMCQYLYAAFTLKQRTEEGLTPEELASVTRWRRQIAHVGTQEMMHLTLVQNMLSAIGGAPHLARPNLPQPANHYPAGVQLALLPFGEQALRHFMFLERPEGMNLQDADGMAAVGRSAPAMQEGEIVPRLQDYATVGHLYRSIEAGFERLSAKFGEESLFVGPPRAQATSESFIWPELVTVTDLASARRAVDEILEQGEGARGHWEDAHFGQFVSILDEYLELKAANPDFDPVRPVQVATVRPCDHSDSVPVITDPVTARCADLFNVSYEILLTTLERYFAHTEETDAELAVLADLTLQLMFQVIKPLGDLLTTLPAGPDYPGMTAGPTFELFYESDYLLPHREAAWILIAERLREAAVFSGHIHAEADADADLLLTGVLEPVGSALAGMADSLTAHVPDRGGPAAAAPDWPPLLAQADELVRPAGGATAGGGPDVGTLLTAAHRALVAMAGSSGSGPDRYARAGARLVRSVLTPLAAAGGRAAGSPAADPAAGVPAGGPAVEEQLWALATAATALRVGQGGPPGLLEATAALQDLAIQFPPSGRDAAGLLAELRGMEAALPAQIQGATGGPYLVTNAEQVVDWLGTPIPTRPQMALCRCGASESKPFCDGTHASIGFTTTKDPKRVADRRDTYVGQQVTIMDNRGVCQHSGFCTDRLSTVFRVGEEPFVRPSGARMDDIVRAVRSCPSGALSYAIGDEEARTQVDQQRPPTIEVSKDGPYRVTGGFALVDGDGVDEVRNEGASREHYSLCRCGSSQNKPFCSGMHWYVDFHDPAFPPAGRQPTLFEWCGGAPALLRLSQVFYGKYVPQDTLIGPQFANLAPDHAVRVANRLAEAFGGPASTTEPPAGDLQMIAEGTGAAVTEEQRARWVALMCQAADEVKLPADAEFRTAFVAYLEWDSRLATESSASGVEVKPDTSVWTWVGNANPGARDSAAAPEVLEPVVVLPADGAAVGFDEHVKGMFRARDRQSMSFVFDLWKYADVVEHATDILARLADGTMPCDGAWPAEQVDAFRRWVETGCPRTAAEQAVATNG